MNVNGPESKVAIGNFASKLDTSLTGQEAAAAFIAALNAAYPPADGAPPSIVVPPERPRLVTNWSNQPHVWGAYSYTRYDGGDADAGTPFEARGRSASRTRAAASASPERRPGHRPMARSTARISRESARRRPS